MGYIIIYMHYVQYKTIIDYMSHDITHYLQIIVFVMLYELRKPHFVTYCSIQVQLSLVRSYSSNAMAERLLQNLFR